MLHTALHPGFSRIHGAGVIALRDLPCGTAVWWPCRRCRLIPPARQPTTPEPVLRWVAEYGYRRADGGFITPCQGAHLLNHSCDASVLDTGLAVGMAVRDIGRGEEITCDYRGFRYEDTWSFNCQCGSPGCVGSVTSTVGKTPPALLAEWQRRIDAALDRAGAVPQETAVLSGDVHVEPERP